MIEKVLMIIGSMIIAVVSFLGYGGIIFLMAIESACIPLPSEIIMPFAGYLVYAGKFNLWLAALAGGLGCLIGSIAAYAVGIYGGRSFIEKYGRYFLISRRDLDGADDFFNKYGTSAIFFSRLLPVIRTFISLPAGIARMNFLKFSIYTFLGSLPWCFGLAYIGKRLGENWKIIGAYFHKFDLAIGIMILIGLVWFLKNRLIDNKY
jgi:membrane protein DedA with SNARE-associated domain